MLSWSVCKENRLVYSLLISYLLVSLAPVVNSFAARMFDYRLFLGTAGIALCLFFVSSLLRGSSRRIWAVGVTGGVLLFFQLFFDLVFFCSGKRLNFELLYHIRLANFPMIVSLFWEEILLGILFYGVLLAGIVFLYLKFPGKRIRKRWCAVGLLCSLPLLLFSPAREAFLDFELRSARFSNEDYRKAGVKVSSISKEEVVASPGKNLVLIYMESLENTFLNERLFPGLTPRLNELKKEALCFDNLAPALNADYTFGGIYASMMGLPLVKQVLRGGFVNSGIRVAVGEKLPSLPSILSSAGYEQVFLRGVNLSFAGMNVFLGRERFDRMAAYETEFPGRSRSWGCSDAVLFDWAFQTFQSLSDQKKPFNLTLLTLDTHAPHGFFYEDSIRYPENQTGSVMLDAVHTMDERIGNFIARLKQTPAWKNTCVILVSDHLMPGGILSEALNRNPRRRLVMMALNCGMQGDRKSAGMTFDIAPTVLDLLGVRHNYVFPLGESLLGPVSEDRLFRTSRQERMIASYTLNHSRYTLLPSRIRVMEKPYPALQFGETLYPFYLNRFGIQDLPDGDMYLLVPLGVNKQPRRMRMVRMLVEKAGKGLEYYLILGKMNRYLRPLVDSLQVPENYWGLFVVKHGKILFDVKPRMEELSLEY